MTPGCEPEEFFEAIERALNSGWSRAHDREEPSGSGLQSLDRWYRKGHPAVVLSLRRQKPWTFTVGMIDLEEARILKRRKIADADYNNVLRDFHDNVVLRIAHDFPLWIVHFAPQPA